MGIKDLFSKKPATAAHKDRPIAESTHARVVETSGVAVASVLCERYSEHESKPIEHDLLSAAGQCAHKLAIDMSRVAMLASAGIGSLISVHQACAKAGGSMAIFGLDPAIAELLKLTRMDRMLVITPTRDDALRALA